MNNILLVETIFPDLSFFPICLTTWKRRDLYLKVISTNPQVVEVMFGSPRRKLREVTYLYQLQDLYKAIYDEQLDFIEI